MNSRILILTLLVAACDSPSDPKSNNGKNDKTDTVTEVATRGTSVLTETLTAVATAVAVQPDAGVAVTPDAGASTPSDSGVVEAQPLTPEAGPVGECAGKPDGTACGTSVCDLIGAESCVARNPLCKSGVCVAVDSVNCCRKYCSDDRGSEILPPTTSPTWAQSACEVTYGRAVCERVGQPRYCNNTVATWTPQDCRNVSCCTGSVCTLLNP